ncbi:MAG: hypothetical protein JSW63_07270 [Ignavibacterium sp.]|nr:MAG: hypothetical protein JSW63_07270 [Ignavibacterium sp.]
MKLLSILPIFILLPNFISAQQEDIFVPSLLDTVLRYQGINPYMNYYYDDFELYFPFNFSVTESEQLVEGDLSILQLRTDLALSYPTSFKTSTVGASDHLMLPYYKQYLENSKIDPIRYILGLAQTAAVGYMAYRHIKKYGFWK